MHALGICIEAHFQRAYIELLNQNKLFKTSSQCGMHMNKQDVATWLKSLYNKLNRFDP